VLEVAFEVFTREGRRVFDLSKRNEQSVLINWDGRNDAGSELPAGTYFYSAKVKFDVLDPSNSERDYRGWVQLIR
jgi:flagellar hook assembly protein FlgD